MSLKGFHIIFVTVSTLLCVFLALWSFLLAPESSLTTLLIGGVGIAGSLLMPIYGIYFYRKITRIHI
jgi:hypothetical protein